MGSCENTVDPSGSEKTQLQISLASCSSAPALSSGLQSALCENEISCKRRYKVFTNRQVSHSHAPRRQWAPGKLLLSLLFPQVILSTVLLLWMRCNHSNLKDIGFSILIRYSKHLKLLISDPNLTVLVWVTELRAGKCSAGHFFFFLPWRKHLSLLKTEMRSN